MSTTPPSATCIGATGAVASSHTPDGVATRQPASRRAIARQCTSRQTDGSRWRLAAISSRKIDGTTMTGGTASEIPVMARSEKPKPAQPRTIAAPNTQTSA